MGDNLSLQVIAIFFPYRNIGKQGMNYMYAKLENDAQTHIDIMVRKSDTQYFHRPYQDVFTLWTFALFLQNVAAL